MTKQELFATIKSLVSSNVQKTEEVKFERVALEGGEVFVTNQTDTEFTLGDTIYVETPEGFELAPAGTHRLEDGREIVLDEESKLVEIRTESEEVEEPLEETSEEVEVEESEEMNAETKIDELKTAIHDLLMAFETYSKETEDRFNKLESDYENFKKSAEYEPVKKDNSFKSKFSAYDARMEAIKNLRK